MVKFLHKFKFALQNYCRVAQVTYRIRYFTPHKSHDSIVNSRKNVTKQEIPLGKLSRQHGYLYIARNVTTKKTSPWKMK